MNKCPFIAFVIRDKDAGGEKNEKRKNIIKIKWM